MLIEPDGVKCEECDNHVVSWQMAGHGFTVEEAVKNCFLVVGHGEQRHPRSTPFEKS